MTSAVAIAGKIALLQWLKFASLGKTNATSRASALSIMLRVCNEFPTKTAMEAVYHGLGESM